MAARRRDSRTTRREDREFLAKNRLTIDQEKQYRAYRDDYLSTLKKRWNRLKTTQNLPSWEKYKKKYPPKTKRKFAEEEGFFIQNARSRRERSVEENRNERERETPVRVVTPANVAPTNETPQQGESRLSRAINFIKERGRLRNTTPQTQESEYARRVRELIRLEDQYARLNDGPSTETPEQKRTRERQIETIRQKIRVISDELLGPRAPSTPPSSPAPLSDYDDNVNIMEAPPTPVPTTVSTEGIVFANNVRSRILFDGVLRTPITVTEIINWGEAKKTIIQKRFCENLIRVVKRLAPRNKQGFSVLAGIVNKITVKRLWEEGYFDPNVPISFFKNQTFRFEDNSMFQDQDGSAMNATLNPSVLYHDNNILPLRFGNIIRPIVGRASALTSDTVVLIKGYYGRQINVPNSGVDEFGDYRRDRERYQIPRKELLQILLLMKCYKREKAHFVASYDPRLVMQTIKPLLRTSFRVGEVVYKPWFNYEEDDVKTLIMKSKTAFRQAIYRMIYELNSSNPSLDARNSSSRTSWQMGWLEGNKDLYKNCKNILDEEFNNFVRRWGGNNEGQPILDLINSRSVQAVQEEDVVGEANVITMDNEPNVIQPLFQLERLDVVFTEERLESFFTNVMRRIERESGRTFRININEVSKKAHEAVFTQKLRDIKKGRIESITGDGYLVDWEVPLDTRSGDMNVTTIDSKIKLQRRNRQSAAFLLSQIARIASPLQFSDSDITVKDLLRNGQGIAYEKIEKLFLDLSKKETIKMELDMTGKLDDIFTTVIIPLFQAVEKIQDKKCKGNPDPNWRKVRGGEWQYQGTGNPQPRIKSVYEEVNDLMREFDRYFVQNNENDRSATRYAKVIN